MEEVTIIFQDEEIEGLMPEDMTHSEIIDWINDNYGNEWMAYNTGN